MGHGKVLSGISNISGQPPTTVVGGGTVISAVNIHAPQPLLQADKKPSKK